MVPQTIVLFKLLNNIISNFVLIKIRGIKWINKDKKSFVDDVSIIFISGLLWFILVNRLIEKMDAIKEDMIKRIIIIVGCQTIILVNIKSSLSKLIEGGAEMLMATKMNHQKDKLGKVFISPFIERMFRVWNFI